MRTRLLMSPLLLLLLLPEPGWSRLQRETTVLPDSPAPVVGRNRFHTIRAGETLVELALRKGVGYRPLTAANPGLDPWLPQAGRELLLPQATVLPLGTEPGITINLAEFRLYYLWREGQRRMVRIYPIGIGTEGWETPLGTFSILQKVSHPSWTAPAAVRREHPEDPVFIPPGPDNPLGDFWLQISPEGHGIHGTNKPLGIGRQVSHGCIRLYPDDIRDLFHRVRTGTPVRIIYQPVKLGYLGEKLVVEAHADFLGRLENPLEEVVRQQQALKWQEPIDFSRLLSILLEARGIPLLITPAADSQ